MKDKSINEIRTLLNQHEGELTRNQKIELEQDPRKGVQALWKQWCKRKEQESLKHERYIEMSKHEQACISKGYRYIAGVDEVGRGPLAGPVVASAVILPEDFQIIGLDDSKKLNEKTREELYEQIHAQAISIGIGMKSAEEIDRINIYEASKAAMMEAIEDLTVRPEYLLIDAMKLPLTIPQESIIKGDAKSNSIAAASIIAKVTRDRYMQDLDKKYPHYSFNSNVGYGTSQHLEALRIHGITEEHRKSFAPVSEISGKQLTIFDDK
ncbi:ribonuclease HII [Pseudalkalibacillus sp. SCS-8]|uniref:ribonuclease HII n=1 Tax=Pseudalkalibacillus nanhaiensis TaxID=3115291 RepID=UPI0032DA4863